jgi:hypothetical protein
VEWRGGKRDDMKEWFERCKSGRDGIKEWRDSLISIEPTQLRVSVWYMQLG